MPVLPSPRVLSWALALLTACPPAMANADIQRQEAQAYARKGGALVYRESHWRYRQDEGARRLVLYRCPDGRAFARKMVIERRRAQAPDFEFEDARDGYREGWYAGQADRADRWRFDYQGNYGYMDGTLGYNGYYVGRNDYRYYFQQGFERVTATVTTVATSTAATTTAQR